ncbi:hypothetical protein [Streptomyces xanthophaeus]|uniref:hypothetical protein n=1 Tax=Streptomyces xanthophaeus TaxID=67385 RepID=UPI0036527D64
MVAKKDPRPALLPDQGAAVDEHGRPPGVPSRTGPGGGPKADPDRVDRARRKDRDRKPEQGSGAEGDAGPRTRAWRGTPQQGPDA